jgi:thiopeptide-type bacteriocin biosynthesis protein
MSPAAGTRWISLHLHGLGDPDAFLVHALGPWVRGETMEGRVRRFFFIRYSEGGDHLRLRFVPGPPGDGGALEASLRNLADASGGGDAAPRVERHAYDRAELYFGETRASVYAELLNEATSWLALSMLQALGPAAGGARWVAAAAALATILRRATDGEAELRQAVAASRRFAHDSALAVGFAVEPTTARAAELGGAVAAAAPLVARALADDTAARRTVVLLRRARRRGPDERFAAVHGLHLLCNKLGLSLRQEHDALVAVQASLAFAGQASSHPPAAAEVA